jgi:hypothetical protein
MDPQDEQDGGGPTDDKPTVILETPRDPDRDALQGAGAVVLALRFTVLKGVIDHLHDLVVGPAGERSLIRSA